MVFDTTSCWPTENTFCSTNDSHQLFVTSENPVQRRPKIDHFNGTAVIPLPSANVSHISSNGYYGYCPTQMQIQSLQPPIPTPSPPPSPTITTTTRYHANQFEMAAINNNEAAEYIMTFKQQTHAPPHLHHNEQHFQFENRKRSIQLSTEYVTQPAKRSRNFMVDEPIEDIYMTEADQRPYKNKQCDINLSMMTTITPPAMMENSYKPTVQTTSRAPATTFWTNLGNNSNNHIHNINNSQSDDNNSAFSTNVIPQSVVVEMNDKTNETYGHDRVFSNLALNYRIENNKMQQQIYCHHHHHHHEYQQQQAKYKEKQNHINMNNNNAVKPFDLETATKALMPSLSANVKNFNEITIPMKNNLPNNKINTFKINNNIRENMDNNNNNNDDEMENLYWNLHGSGSMLWHH